MVYRFFWILTMGAMRGWYRRIFYSGKKHFPRKGAVILACNHPNAFMEGLVLPCVQYRPLYVMTRGDVFAKKLHAWILGVLKMIPVYRRQDAKNNHEKNIEAFRGARKLLLEKKCVLIFSEAICVMEKRMRPIRKGTARLAFETMVETNWELDLEIVPTGINYTYPDKPRSEVMVQHSKGIKLQEYREQYEENPAKATLSLTHRISDELAKNIITIDRKEDENLTEGLFQLGRNQRKENSGHLQFTGERLAMELNIANQVNEWDQQKRQQLSSELENYFKALDKEGIKDRYLVKPKGNLIVNLIGLLLGLPFFIVGYLLNILQVKAGLNVAKNKVRLVHFKASIAVAITEIANLGLILILIILGIFWTPWCFAGILIIPFLGFLALKYHSYWEKVRGVQRAHKNSNFRNEMLARRKKIMANLEL